MKMKTQIKGFIAQQSIIDDMAEELFANKSIAAVIDGGDHQITAWVDSNGKNVIVIQGLTSNVSVLREV